MYVLRSLLRDNAPESLSDPDIGSFPPQDRTIQYPKGQSTRGFMAIPFLHRVLRYIYLLALSPVPIEILEPCVIYDDHYYFAFTTLPRHRYYTRAGYPRVALEKRITENLYGVLLRLILRAASGFDNKGILLGTTRP